MIGVIVQFQKWAFVEKMERYNSKMGSGDKSVLVQFEKMSGSRKV
jgi:hypothetical protein